MPSPPESHHTLRQQADELFAAARENPDSEAGEMVQVLVYAGVSHLQPHAYDENPGLALGGERQRYQLARERRVGERRAAPPPGRTAAPEAEGRTEDEAGGASRPELERQVRAHETRLRKVTETVERFKAAAEAGHTLDPMAVYDKIFEIVGLRAPAENGPAQQ